MEERDKQITTLKRRLEEVAGDLDINAALMEDVRSELNKSSRGPGDHQMKKISSMQTTLRVQQGHLKDAEIRAQEVINKFIALNRTVLNCQRVREHKTFLNF